MFDIIVLLNLENNSDTVVSRVNFNLKYHDQYEFTLNLIQLVNVFNLFPLEVLQ